MQRNQDFADELRAELLTRIVKEFSKNPKAKGLSKKVIENYAEKHFLENCKRFEEEYKSAREELTKGIKEQGALCALVGKTIKLWNSNSDGCDAYLKKCLAVKKSGRDEFGEMQLLQIKEEFKVKKNVCTAIEQLVFDAGLSKANVNELLKMDVEQLQGEIDAAETKLAHLNACCEVIGIWRKSKKIKGDERKINAYFNDNESITEDDEGEEEYDEYDEDVEDDDDVEDEEYEEGEDSGEDDEEEYDESEGDDEEDEDGDGEEVEDEDNDDYDGESSEEDEFDADGNCDDEQDGNEETVAEEDGEDVDDDNSDSEEGPQQQCLHDDIASEISNGLTRMRCSSLFLGEAIPDKKLRNACESMNVAEPLYVLIDSTVWGGSREGMVVTGNSIYCKNIDEDPVVFQLGELPPISFCKQVISFGEYELDLSGAMSATQVRRLASVIRKAVGQTSCETSKAESINEEKSEAIAVEDSDVAEIQSEGCAREDDVVDAESNDCSGQDGNTSVPAIPDPDSIGDVIIGVIDSLGNNDFYSRFKIPSGKLASAKESMSVPKGENVYGLLDSTFWGSAKNGLIITSYGLRWKNDWSTESAITKLSWQEVAKLVSTIKTTEYDVIFKQNARVCCAGSGVEPKDVVKVLRRIVGM